MTATPQSSAEKAEADRLKYQTIIEEQSQEGAIIAVKSNLDLWTALIIPLPRLTEFNNASAVDKLRFISICQKALQRERTEGVFLDLFEDEYIKEFV